MSSINASNFPESCQSSLNDTPTSAPFINQLKWSNKSTRRLNSSLEEETTKDLGDTLEMVAWCFMYSVFSIIIIIGNALTVSIFRTNARFSRKKEHCFLVSLAIADMLVGIASMPLQVFLLVQSWFSGNLARYLILNRVFLTTDVFFGLASIFTLNAISLERLYSVLRPRKHRKVKARTYWYLVRVPWGISGLQSLLYFLSLTNILPFDVVFQFIAICLLFSMMSMWVSYAAIWILMTKKRRNQNSQTSTLTVTKSDFQVNKERKLTILVVIVTSVFAVTWLPFQIMNFVFYLCHLNGCKPDVSTSLIRLVKLLQYSNSLINPFIYSYNIKGFRKCLRRKLLFHLSCLYPVCLRIKTNPKLNPKGDQRQSKTASRPM